MWSERGRRAWSRLSQSASVRNGVRALVFAGAVGVTWLIGSSAAQAHHGMDAEAEAQRAEVATRVERTVFDRLLHPDACATPSQRQPGATEFVNRTDVSQRFELPPESCDSPDSRESRESTDSDREPARHAAPDPQAPPRSAPSQLENSGGTANAAPGNTVVGPLTEPVRTVTDGKITAAAVDHTEGTVTGLGAPLTDAIRPVTDAAGTITRPVTGQLPESPVTDEITDRVFPGLGGTVDRLVPLPPVAGLPQGNQPAAPAPPVAPGVDQSTGSTSTVDLGDEAYPGGARQTGKKVGSSTVPNKPVPAPLPAVPGSGVISGYAMGSSVPLPGGGATATVPAFPSHDVSKSGASLATAHVAALRDLAGEPAVSPD